MSDSSHAPTSPEKSLSTQTKAPKTKQKHRISYIIKHWKWESLCLFLAILLQLAMVIILIQYDSEELPDWPYGININTIIALLGTFLRASLVVVLAEVISQAKWSWIDQREQPAADLQVFDKASRGVPGSFQLLWLLRFRHWSASTGLATAAALVTIFSLGTAPFAQQAIGTLSCSKIVQHATANLSVANAIPGSDGMYTQQMGGRDLVPGSGFRAAVVNGLSNPAGNDSAAEFSCPTGNCDYGYGQAGSTVPLSTIGICSRCVDVSHHVEIDLYYGPAPTYWIPLPNTSDSRYATPTTSGGEPEYLNLSISGFKTFAEMAFKPMPWRAGYDIPDEYAELAKYAITNITILSFTGAKRPEVTNSSDKLGVTASSCSLYGCVQDFEAKVRNGRLEERILGTRALPFSNYNPMLQGESVDGVGIAASIKSPCIIDEKWYTHDNFSSVAKDEKTRVFVDFPHDRRNISVPSDCLYMVAESDLYYDAMDNWLTPALTGVCSFMDTNTGSCGEQWYLGGLFRQGKATHDTISEDFTSLSRVLTHFFRADGWGFSNETWRGMFNEDYRPDNLSKTPDNKRGYINGTVWESTVCVQVNWPWIIYPSSLCVLTTLLLFGIAVSSCHNADTVPPWKSSILPLLLYSFVESRPRFTGGPSDYERVAKTTTVMIPSLGLDADAGGEGSVRGLDRAEVDSLLTRDDS